jgi:hypothetical protein
MNANDLLDYSLRQLDGPTLGQAEQALAADPAAAESVRRLTLAIHQLLDDGEEFLPPPDLAARTVSFVAANARRRRTILDFVPARVPFRWTDVAVAAGILLAGLFTLLPAVQKSREGMEQAGCAYNLQQLGRALWQYGSRHHHYPFSPEENPKAPVGAYVALLHDGGWLSQDELDRLDCPCNGHQPQHGPLPDFNTVCKLHETNPAAARSAIRSDYAYNVGYRHALLGRVVPIAAVHEANVPLLADQPPQQANYRTVSYGNSPNHGGRGQNVLYSDLHIGWHNTRRLGPNDADMYLNELRQIAPGVNAKDASLLPSMMRATGE